MSDRVRDENFVSSRISLLNGQTDTSVQEYGVVYMFYTVSYHSVVSDVIWLVGVYIYIFPHRGCRD